ncbi:MAG: polysaccharide biosynthesis tyrosine autokinase [Planctomycetota bacterium]
MDRPQAPHNAGEEIHLGDYIRVIRKRLWLFVGVFVLVAAAGTVYTFLITPEYQAEIKLEILDTPEGGMNLLAGLSGLKGDRIDTEIEKVRSRDVARAVVLNRDLNAVVTVEAGNPRVAVTGARAAQATRRAPCVVRLAFHDNGSRFTVTDAQGTVLGTGADGTFDQGGLVLALKEAVAHDGDQVRVTIIETEAAVDRLLDRMSVYRIGDTRLVGIAVRDTDPERARATVAECARVFAGRNLEEKNAAAREVNRFISDRRAVYEERRTAAAGELQAFKEKHNIFSLDARSASLVEQMGGLEKERAARTLEWERLDNAIGQVARNGGTTPPEIFPPQSALEQLASRLALLTVERERLLSQVTASHPQVVAVDAQIAEIRRTILAKLTSTRDVVQGDLDGIARQLAAFDDQIKTLPELDKEGVEKLRSVKFYEEMVMQMAAKAEEFAIVEVSTLSSVRVTQEAWVPGAPVKPRRGVNILLALVLAAVAGLGAVFLREYFDNTFNTTEEVAQALGLPVLVTIPCLRRRGAGEVVMDRKEGLAYLTLDSPVTEAFKTLKTAVEFMEHGATHRVVQVTSSVAGEGKSTIAANLAISFATAGHTTLLVDADYRQPTVHQIMRTENQAGLVDILFKGMSWHETVQETQVPGLKVITSGLAGPSIAQGIRMESLAPFIADVKAAYDYVVVDSPPCMAVDDSLRVGRVMDMVLLVVDLGHADRGTALRCVGRCRQNGIRITGLVVNDCKGMERYSRTAGYYQYYLYGRNITADTVERKWRIRIGK